MRQRKQNQEAEVQKSAWKEFLNEGMGDKLFDVLIYVLVLAAMAVTLYPFIYVVSISLSSGTAVNQGRVVLFPVELSLETYKMVMAYKELWISYGNTIFIPLQARLSILYLPVWQHIRCQENGSLCAEG